MDAGEVPEGEVVGRSHPLEEECIADADWWLDEHLWGRGQAGDRQVQNSVVEDLKTVFLADRDDLRAQILELLERLTEPPRDGNSRRL